MDWQAALQEFAKTTGGFLAFVITKTSGGLISIVVNVFVTLFIIFYFFRDGEKILAKLRELLPLNKQYQDILMSRFAAVSRATIKGGILIGEFKVQSARLRYGFLESHLPFCGFLSW